MIKDQEESVKRKDETKGLSISSPIHKTTTSSDDSLLKLKKMITQTLNNQVKERNLKPLNIMYLVIGRYDPKITFLMKMGSKTEKYGSRFQISNKGETNKAIDAFNELFLRQDPPNTKYSLTILNTQSNLNQQYKVKRRFLSVMSASTKAFLSFVTSSPNVTSNKKEEYTLSEGDNKKIICQSDINQFLTKFLKILLDRHNFQTIKQEFQKLINHQLEKMESIESQIVKEMYQIEMRRVEKAEGEKSVIQEKLRSGEALVSYTNFQDKIDVVNGKLFYTLPR